MIPLKVQYRLPTYRTGAVSAGGTHQGNKKIVEQYYKQMNRAMP